MVSLDRQIAVIAIVVCLMAVLSASRAGERNDSLAGGLVTFLESEYSGRLIDRGAIDGFLNKWSEAHFEQRKDFVHSAGSEMGAMVVDLDGNGYQDVVVAEAVSEKEANILVFWRSERSIQIRQVKLDVDLVALIERTTLLRMDLTNAGEMKDLVVRFVGSGRVYAKSVDCFVVFRDRNVAGPEPYSTCFAQDAAAEDSQYVLSKWPDTHTFPVSHVVDINHDGRYEVVVTSLVAPVDVATSAYWPDIYEWSGTGFVKSNKLFPMYYRAYKFWLIEKYGNRSGQAGVISVLRKIDRQLEGN